MHLAAFRDFLAARAAPAIGGLLRARVDDKSLACRRYNIIHRDGLCIFKELLLDQEGETAGLEDLVAIIWLVQSHPQLGAASANPCDEYPQRFDFFA
jgi:hypothetical protein